MPDFLATGHSPLANRSALATRHSPLATRSALATQHSALTTRHSPLATRAGFTLIELGVVILIIGIVLGFIVVASMGSTEAARTRATQALITKLEVGLNERIQALTTLTPPVNGSHQWLAAIFYNDPGLRWGLPSGQRAAAIARFDQMRMEIPDVFYIQNYNPSGNVYPINFAGLPFPMPNAIGPPQPAPFYALPLGQLMAPGYNPPPGTPPYSLVPDPTHPEGPGAGMPVGTETGIYGAAYTVRAALHKLIGYDPTGTDGVDNDGDGFVDEYDEGVVSAEAAQKVQTFLSNHTHDTARAEMLYALLVEGAGPMGSVFGKEEFQEGVDYADTDGDGLPEFIDGWRRPLHFYRWPVYYQSPNVQGGSAAYSTTFQPRESFPLDANNQLVAPGWWGDLNDQNPPINPSVKSLLFQQYFTTLIDPNYGQPNTAQANYWDRTGAYGRRAFGCKFLIVSSGPDQVLGLYQLDNDFVRSVGAGSQPDTVAAMLIGNPLPVAPGGNPPNYSPTQFGENWAVSVFEVDEYPNAPNYNGYPMQRALNNMLIDGVTIAPPRALLDNIDNHNLQTQAGGVR